MNYFDQKIFSYYFKIKFKLSPHFGHFPSYFMLKLRILDIFRLILCSKGDRCRVCKEGSFGESEKKLSGKDIQKKISFVERSHQRDDFEFYIPHLLKVKNQKKDFIRLGKLLWQKV